MPTPTIQIPDLSELNKVRFWSKVDRRGPTMPHMESACWIWTAAKDLCGYGSFNVAGKTLKAHRIAYIESGGVFPENKPYCLHKCDNPRCCNPAHIFAGSHQDNMIDRESKGRGNTPKGASHWSWTRPERRARGAANGRYTKPEATARGEMHPRCKITDKQCEYIRSSLLSGAAIARELGVSSVQVCSIRKGTSRRMTHYPQLPSPSKP